ncbi:hypothetical protein MTO96_011708 [Rhipicephalus appendiculatus]
MDHILENMKLFNTSSKRLVLFAQTVRLATLQSEYGWKLLTLGFNMFMNKTRITEEEMKDVIGKLPGPTNGTQFQEVINSMIVYDLLMFNGTSEYDSWMRMEWQRFTIMSIPGFSREVQSLLYNAGKLKPLDDWYVVQLTELIMMKLTMLSLNASSAKDIDTLLSSNLDVGVTPEFLKAQKDFLKKNKVSPKILEGVYYSDLSSKMFSSLIYVNDSYGSCVEPAENLPHISPKNVNNTEALAKDVDAIIDKVKESNNTNIGEICLKELFLLKLLTMSNYDEVEVAWRDITVMKWANMSDMEGAAGAAFAPNTYLALRLYILLNESTILELVEQELKLFVQTDNVTKQAEEAMHEKLIKVAESGTIQASEFDSMYSSPMPAANRRAMSARDEIVEPITTEKVSTVETTHGSPQGVAATSTVDAGDATAGTPASQ